MTRSVGHCVHVSREGESLGGFDHVWTLMTRSVGHCVHVSRYESPKERERSLDQRASRLLMNKTSSQLFDASRS